ncbi:S9 family peptidase [Anaeromyxobacter oryzae]|uniref:Peptidase S9 family protein n=1 Tax=Anaeromyxobacter oryzae TaxID=2918170 RepID=A0ABM7WYC5_9BACT|nr:prolyl oligopeptidase family serine peptidase [Anaeromyxobacter oryzae]BDG04465.1 peptidase S9 family protein [Anaeromyxobacter oryzae]
MTTALLLALALAAETPASTLDVAPVPGRPNLLQLGVPPVPPELAARLNQYQNVRAASLMDVADDGSALLVRTRFGNTSQLHVVTRPLGMREQITFGDEPVLEARFAAGDPRTVYYLQDKGGGEFYQLYRLDRRTGRSALLTDGKSRHEALVVSPTGRHLAWAGTDRNGKDSDVYVASTTTRRQARVVEGSGTFTPVAFSRDGLHLLVLQFRSIADADLILVTLGEDGSIGTSGPPRRLLEHAGIRGAAFAPDGASVLVASDLGSGDWVKLRSFPVRDGPRGAPFPAGAWDVEALELAPDGRLAFTVNEDGYSRLYVADGPGAPPRRIEIPAGEVTRLVFPRGRKDLLALSVMTATAPEDAYVVSLRTGKAERWTRSEVGGLDPATFVAPELVRYPSTDGITVPAFLYRPPGGARRPVIIDWHGGPEGQNRPVLKPTVQYLVTELGFAVLQPNVRGSDGYGKAYLAADDGVKREASLADIGATLDFIGKDPRLDAGRVASWGGSYGGYMVLASLVFQPARIRAGVDVVGISSLPTFLESTQAYRRDLRRAEYGDERIPEVRAVQERISPLNHADLLRAPLLVIQGRNDPRVPQSEAEQIVKAVRANGKEVWYLLALDEGHGFQKKENRDVATAVTILFLERMLRETAEPAPVR